jgi:methyl-accepting chemotaxis protein
LIHPSMEGSNIYQYDFVKAMCGNKKGFIQYNWLGKPKVASYDYYSDRDWVIVSSSYLSDFTESLIIIQYSIIIIIILSIITVGFITFIFTGNINKTLKMAITNLDIGASQIKSASSELADSSQELANGATEQASSIEETTSSMEELATMVSQNLENSKEASLLSDKASGASNSGYSLMEKLMNSMNGINNDSGKIRKIVKVIDEIAFQTNILALNAAVEAARAGKSGMGFAVVADEVKNLANKSAAAAKETSEMIMDTIKKTQEGFDLSASLAEVFKDILSNSQKVSEITKEVETASKQQDIGINQINKVLLQFDEVIQTNAAAAEENAGSSEELMAQSDNFNGIVKDLVILIMGDGNKINQKGMLDNKTGKFPI